MRITRAISLPYTCRLSFTQKIEIAVHLYQIVFNKKTPPMTGCQISLIKQRSLLIK